MSTGLEYGSGFEPPIDHPDFDNIDTGWRPNPAGVQSVMNSLPHPPELVGAAPDWVGDGDGMTGDLIPYLSMYEIEIVQDGKVWKPKGAEFPYIPQTGNNCTSKGLADGNDASQAMAISLGEPIGFQRTCIEACYAFGLFKAGMRGDNGCYGGAMAGGGFEIGLLPYSAIEMPHEEDHARLQSWANNPRAIVDKYGPIASAYKFGSITRVTTWNELCAAVANQCYVTIASNVGFNTPRDDKGICRRRGTWRHQMFIFGILRSDGVETATVLQSWGPNRPSGPRPFKLPSFAFRALRADVESILRQGDSWAIRRGAGFEKRRLADRWVNTGLAA